MSIEFSAPLHFSWNGEFKIVQFTDLHITDWGVSDAKTVKLMGTLMDLEKPDLVVLTGDVIAGGAAPSPAQALDFALTPIVERGIPFAMMFGNHDDEGDLDREALLALLETKPGNLTQRGPAYLPGVGNYVLRIDTVEGRLAAALHIFDSHAYSSDETEIYACLSPLQSSWHTAVCKNIAAERPDFSACVPQLCFFHIPLPEYEQAQQCILAGHRQEPVCCSRTNRGFFDALQATAHVNGVFVGHDHCNDFVANWHGITLGYGRGSGFGGYGQEGFPRGARFFRLFEDQRTFETWVRLEGGIVSDRLSCQKTVTKNMDVCL